MKRLCVYINEAADKIKATTEWMIETYPIFNEMYFNNELPPCDLQAKILEGNLLGCQGEHYGYWVDAEHMENGKYRMYRKSKGQRFKSTGVSKYGVLKGKWEPIIDENTPITNISEIHPYIYINTKYLFEQDELEDTLIHEMIHLWTFKDGLAPKQAHGKEFKAKCKEIRDIATKDNKKKYHLTTRADAKTGTFEREDKAEQLAAKQEAKRIFAERNARVVTILFTWEEADKLEHSGFMFCGPRILKQLLPKIKHYFSIKLKKIYITTGTYVDACDIYGKFSIFNKFERYYKMEAYPKLNDLFINNAEDVTMLENLNEAKKPYIKPMIKLIEIPANINLSIVNVEDIVNLFTDKDFEDKEVKGTKENDKNLVTV